MYLIKRPILDILPQLQHFEMYQYYRLEKVSVSVLTVFLIILRIFQKWNCQSQILSCCYFCEFFSLFFTGTLTLLSTKHKLPAEKIVILTSDFSFTLSNTG